MFLLASLIIIAEIDVVFHILGFSNGFSLVPHYCISLSSLLIISGILHVINIGCANLVRIITCKVMQ